MHALHSPSTRVALLAAVAPAAVNPGTVTTPWIDMRDNFTVLAILSLGVLGAAATVDVKFQQATSAAGAGVKDVPGTTIVQMTKGSGDDGKQALINIRQNDLDRYNGFRFVRLSVTVGGAASQLAAIVTGLDRRHGDGPSGNIATVDQIVGR